MVLDLFLIKFDILM